MPLTAAKIRSAEPSARPYKIADGLGLFLHVATTGTKTFRMACRFEGRAQLLTFGRVPEISLAQARERRDDVRQALRRGEDPTGGRWRTAAAPASNDGPPTFGELARAWLVDQAERWTAVHSADVEASLALHVLPAIGATSINKIAAPDVLRVLRQVEATGSIETARRLRQRISAVFARAIAEGVVDVDPAARVTKALRRPAEPKHHAAALTMLSARRVLRAVDQVAGVGAAALAFRFLALTAVRWAAVRGARWSEIEGLDGPAPTWRVPAARMKMARARKADAGNDHLVPLSPAAAAVLRLANSHAADGNMHGAALIFPGRGGRELGENALAELCARAGLQGQHTPHGWRAAFSTILNEARPPDRAAIDLALAHAPKDKVEAAYNRSEQLGRRRELFDLWGDILMGDGNGSMAQEAMAA